MSTSLLDTLRQIVGATHVLTHDDPTADLSAWEQDWRKRSRGTALAVSAPGALRIGGRGHILHPATGLPAPARWTGVSITAPTAALADALSTAACLMPDRAAIDALVAGFDGAACVAAA